MTDTVYSKGFLINLKDIDKVVSGLISDIVTSIVMISTSSNDCDATGIGNEISIATGFFIDNRIIVTVSHFLDEDRRGLERSLCIVTTVGEIVKGVVIGVDDKYDILFISTESKVDHSVIPLTYVNPIIGSISIAGGMAYGILRPFFSLGIVSGYEVKAPINNRLVEGLMLLSTPILPGMSGGPVVGLNGQLYGVIVAKYSDSNEFALAIPVSRIYFSYEILRRYGKVSHIKLGLVLIDYKPKLYSYGFRNGLIVSRNDNEKLKEFCSIESNDIILSINNINLNSLEDLRIALDLALINNKDIEITYYDFNKKRIERCTVPIYSFILHN
ncbi:Trypsin-like serine protease typically periplasmic contain C-terminal PDZ domain [Ignisphaera aggregans DSM 17230]|uniref:Trypsin-like serine protease typically periplasmic contain C-terminal PDZ domain n=1 Tax=Ignisphaera aggregans (strain DSM 17230 / JCM 13409 / AQ1.S1) TaxID=583356 RepID=E0STG0_IGNAA|nr:Trypsin-like serine protease typically periplasmic contain C-terminal PDZ domain [Ignisphaera aggregans DSM 17230]